MITRTQVSTHLTDTEDKPKLTLSEVRARAFILGLLIIPADNYWVITMEKVNNGPYPTVIAVFANTVFMLTLLIAINSLMKRVWPRACLTTAEILLIYSMVTLAAALAGHDMMPTVVAFMSYPYRAVVTNPVWNDTFLPHLPKWLHVSNPEVIKPLYEGESSLYIHGHWTHWIVPGLAWAGFFVVLVWTMMCINVLVRKHWLEHERLTFPIVQLPLAMTDPQGTLWRNRLFWIGFAICFGIELVNGLSVYWPAIPQFNLTERDHNLLQNVTSKPWSAAGWLPYTFYPFVIGIGYLLPTDLCFSVWFFFLTWKVQKIIACILGMEVGFDDPYIRHQEAGGVIAIIIMLLLTSRGYLKQIWLKIVGTENPIDDSREPLSYRLAALGAIVGFVILATFMRAIGMSPVLTLVAFALYFILATVVTRIRAELGPPVHDMPFTPDYLITSAVGTSRLSNGDILGMGYFHAFHGAYRAHPMPIGLEGMKMATSARSDQKKMFWGLVAATAVGATSTVWAYLHLAYKYGLDRKWNYGAAWGWTITKLMHNWWMRGQDVGSPDWSANFAMLAGFVFCLLLGIARMKIISFPFHPIGYVISGTYQAHLVWLPLLIAWLAKVNILRYGGLQVYRSALPLFFGLIVGELTMGCLWGIIGMLFHIPYYNFFGA